MRGILGANDRRGGRNPRYKWLASIINSRGYAIGAEIGCDLGTTTTYLLSHCSGLSMVVVDSWKRRTVIGKSGGQYVFHSDIHYAEGVFRKRIDRYPNRVRILKGDSIEMSENVLDASLDFIFIDADHSYSAVRSDILAWNKKLIKGGMISGHDINMPEVLKAVKELIPKFKEVGKDHCWEAKKEDVIR